MTPTISLTTTHEVPAPTREQCEAYMRRRGYIYTDVPYDADTIRAWYSAGGEYIIRYPVETFHLWDVPPMLSGLAKAEHRSQLEVYQDMISMEVGT